MKRKRIRKEFASSKNILKSKIQEFLSETNDNPLIPVESEYTKESNKEERDYDSFEVIDEENLSDDEPVHGLFAEFEETTFASPVNYHPSGEIYGDNTGEEKLAEPDIWLRIVPKPNFSKLKNF
jgi:hypothetical protein